MKRLNEKLSNGVIPILEIARMIYTNQDESEYDYVDFNNPEFDKEGKLLVSFCGDKNGTGVTDWLFFDNNQFKIKVCDCYWTSDTYNEYVRVVEINQIPLLKKLIELGVISSEDVGM